MITYLCDDFRNAYHSGHSTETTLIKLTNDIIGYLYDYEHLTLFLLYLSSDFDILDHNILISRLSSGVLMVHLTNSVTFLSIR